MKEHQPLINIGYPKCASTWLQEVVFNNEKLGFFAPWGSSSDIAVEEFAGVDAFRFSSGNIHQYIQKALKGHYEQIIEH